MCDDGIDVDVDGDVMGPCDGCDVMGPCDGCDLSADEVDVDAAAGVDRDADVCVGVDRDNRVEDVVGLFDVDDDLDDDGGDVGVGMVRPLLDLFCAGDGGVENVCSIYVLCCVLMT